MRTLQMADCNKSPIRLQHNTAGQKRTHASSQAPEMTQIVSSVRDAERRIGRRRDVFVPLASPQLLKPITHTHTHTQVYTQVYTVLCKTTRTDGRHVREVRNKCSSFEKKETSRKYNAPELFPDEAYTQPLACSRSS